MSWARIWWHQETITNVKAVFWVWQQLASAWDVWVNGIPHNVQMNVKIIFLNFVCHQDTDKFVEELVTPVLNCLSDPEVRVRYFASESLYNIVKVARSSIIPLFPRIFSALSRLVTGKTHLNFHKKDYEWTDYVLFLLNQHSDSDENCKNGSELLDRLLKDIVTESSQTFDLDAFIPLLRERIYAKNSFARQFIISWISVLNAVPEINMIIYLPEILDGLFQMLDDNSVEIHTT